MTRDSDIIPSSLPPAAQNAASALRRWGFFIFWTNIVLGIIATVALVGGLASNWATKTNTQGAIFGLFCAICGIIVLGISTYFAQRYISVARSLMNSQAINRPGRAETKNFIRMGLIASLIGMLFSLIGTQVAVGNVLIKTLQQTGALVGGQNNCNIVPADALSVQANTTAVTAHFIGIIISIWLLAGVINKHPESGIKS